MSPRCILPLLLHSDLRPNVQFHPCFCASATKSDTLQLLVHVDVLLHATETKAITLSPEEAPSRANKLVRHDASVFRILRFCSDGAAQDWKVDAVGPPAAARTSRR